MNAISGVRVEATDEVDTLVDALMKDPSKVEDVKAALRRISEPHVVDLRTAQPPRPLDRTDDDDSGDMWDNVPV